MDDTRDVGQSWLGQGSHERGIMLKSICLIVNNNIFYEDFYMKNEVGLKKGPLAWQQLTACIIFTYGQKEGVALVACSCDQQ